MEIRLVEAKLFLKGRSDGRRTDGQTDLTMLIIAFSNSANAPKTNRLMSL